MDNEFSFKELYDVIIKTTQNIDNGAIHLVKGETIAHFDKIMIANFKEIQSYATAHGGYSDADHVWWKTSKGISLQFTQGIFSKAQFALMTNASLFKLESDRAIYLPTIEQLESDENGLVHSTNELNGPLFVYNTVTGEKLNLTEYSIVDNQTINVGTPYMDITLDYRQKYNNGVQVARFCLPITNGTYSLTGRTRVKDDITGRTTTGIIMIPRLRLMSDLSIKLGENAIPVAGTINALAEPLEPSSSDVVMEMAFLNDDIDSDM